jgi:hypothetical protein
MRTTESITGTSIKTPTTVASAAPELKPKRLIAAATASSKKLLAPIRAEGPGDRMLFTRNAIHEIGEPRIQIDLDQDRHGEKGNHQWLVKDLPALKAKQQHQSGEQGRKRNRLQCGKYTGEHGGTAGSHQSLPQELRHDHRDHDVEHHRKNERISRHRDRG